MRILWAFLVAYLISGCANGPSFYVKTINDPEHKWRMGQKYMIGRYEGESLEAKNFRIHLRDAARAAGLNVVDSNADYIITHSNQIQSGEYQTYMYLPNFSNTSGQVDGLYSGANYSSRTTNLTAVPTTATYVDRTVVLEVYTFADVLRYQADTSRHITPVWKGYGSFPATAFHRQPVRVLRKLILYLGDTVEGYAPLR